MCLDTFEGMAGSVNGISVGVTENSLDLGQPEKPPGEKIYCYSFMNCLINPNGVRVLN